MRQQQAVERCAGPGPQFFSWRQVELLLVLRDGGLETVPEAVPVGASSGCASFALAAQPLVAQPVAALARATDVAEQ
jgi:hypothetical protein